MQVGMQTDRPVLAVDHLRRVYRGGRGVIDVSFTLRAGVWGLLGPNGAGKTTLLEVVATASPPDRGNVSILGREVDASSLRTLRREIGYLPQEPHLPGGLRVADYLDYVATLKEMPGSVRSAAVERALADVELLDRRRDRIRTLSGGMRQRVALARALLGTPRLLVLDEPSVGFDPRQRAALRDLLMRRASEAAIILSSHQVEDVAITCNQLLVLSDGRLVFEGTVAEACRRASGRVWVSPSMHGEALASTLGPDGRFRNVGTPPAGSELMPPTLEDAYLVLVGESPTQP